MKSDIQKYKGTLEFTYEAEIFPEDPEDFASLELLEADDLSDYFSLYIEETLVNGTFINLKVDAI